MSGGYGVAEVGPGGSLLSAFAHVQNPENVGVQV